MLQEGGEVGVQELGSMREVFVDSTAAFMYQDLELPLGKA